MGSKESCEENDEHQLFRLGALAPRAVSLYYIGESRACVEKGKSLDADFKKRLLCESVMLLLMTVLINLLIVSCTTELWKKSQLENILKVACYFFFKSSTLIVSRFEYLVLYFVTISSGTK